MMGVIDNCMVINEANINELYNAINCCSSVDDVEGCTSETCIYAQNGKTKCRKALLEDINQVKEYYFWCEIVAGRMIDFISSITGDNIQKAFTVKPSEGRYVSLPGLCYSNEEKFFDLLYQAEQIIRRRLNGDDSIDDIKDLEEPDYFEEDHYIYGSWKEWHMKECFRKCKHLYGWHSDGYTGCDYIEEPYIAPPCVYSFCDDYEPEEEEESKK